MRNLSRFLLALLAFIAQSARSAESIYIEAQVPPGSSSVVSLQGSPLGDWLVNVEITGRVTLWKVSASVPQKISTMDELAMTAMIVPRSNDEFGIAIALGTHLGRLKLYASNGHKLCESAHDGPDIDRIAFANVDGLIVSTNAKGEVSLWKQDCTSVPWNDSASAATTRTSGLAVPFGSRRVVTASYDGVLRQYDSSSRALVAEMKLAEPGNSYKGGIRGIAVSALGDQFAVATDSRIDVYSTDALASAIGGNIPTPLWSISEVDFFQTMEFLPSGDGVLYSTISDDLRIQFRSGAKLVPVTQLPGPVASIAVSSRSGLIASGFADFAPRFWTLGYFRRSAEVRVSDSAIAALAIGPSKIVAAIAKDGAGCLIDDKGTVARVLLLSVDTFAADWSSDGTWLITGGRGVELEARNLKSGAMHRAAMDLREWIGKASLMDFANHQFGNVRFLPGGQRFFATSSWDFLSIWTIGSEWPERTIRFPRKHYLADATVSRAGHIALARVHRDLEDAEAPDSEINIIEPGKHDLRSIPWPKSFGLLQGVALSEDGSQLVTTEFSGSARTVDIASATITGPYVASDRDSIVAARFVRGGRQLLTLSTSGALRLFDVGTRQERNVFPTSRAWMSGEVEARELELSQDETLAAVGFQDGYVQLWNLGLSPTLGQFPARNINVGTRDWIGDHFPPMVCGIVGSDLSCWTLTESPQRPRITSSIDPNVTANFALNQARSLVAATVAPGVIAVESLITGKSTQVRASDDNPDLQWSGDGRYLYLQSDYSLQRLDIPTELSLVRAQKLLQEPEGIATITPLKEGRYAVLLPTSRKIRVANSEGKIEEVIPVEQRCERYFRHLPIRFSSDERQVAIACDAGVLMLHREAEWTTKWFYEMFGTITSVSFDKNDTRLSVSSDAGSVMIVDVSTGTKAHRVDLGMRLQGARWGRGVLWVLTDAGEIYIYDDDSYEKLGHSILGAHGVVSIAASYFAHVGNSDIAVTAHRGGQILSTQETLKQLSPSAFERAVLSHASWGARLASRLKENLERTWKAYTVRSTVGRIYIGSAVLYICFAVSMLGIWIISPWRMSAWAMRWKYGSNVKDEEPGA